MEAQKLVCDCGWCGTEPLVAPHPFIHDNIIYGCPKCKDVELRPACDQPGCCEQTTAGTSIPGGYRRTCSRHIPSVHSIHSEFN